MTLKETSQILTYLETLFPASTRNQTEQQKILTVQIWQAELSRYSFAQVQEAVRKAIREKKPNGFAPGFDEIIAQLKPAETIMLPEYDDYEERVLKFFEEKRKNETIKLKEG